MAPVPRLLSVSKMAFGAQFISQLEHYTLRLLINEAVPLVPTVKRDAFKRMMSNSPILSGLLWTAKYKGLGLEHHSCRFSTISSTPDDVVMHELLHFIRSALDKHEGTNHCWLNKNGKALFRKDGPYVVLVGVFLEDAMLNHYHEHHFMFERLKSLQRKYPVLQVFGFQPGCPVHSLATQSMVIKTIMEEYITFPILLSEKNFGLSNEPCYLLLENIASSLIHREWDVDPEVIVKDLEGFDLLCGGDAATVTVSSNMKVDHAEFEDEPSACSPLRNLLLFYPCCISADDCGNRLFLSDTNHHRIIVTDLDGKVIDCIGSSPGFEDGEFGTAKLLRPAGSLYDGSEDCLYFVDSENHAVRRADMGKRVLETLYPVHNRGSSGVWSWILDKLGLGKTFQTEFKEFEKVFLSNPWHLLKSREEDLLVFSRR